VPDSVDRRRVLLLPARLLISDRPGPEFAKLCVGDHLVRMVRIVVKVAIDDPL
jgi:hypothetical protein